MLDINFIFSFLKTNKKIADFIFLNKSEKLLFAL